MSHMFFIPILFYFISHPFLLLRLLHSKAKLATGTIMCIMKYTRRYGMYVCMYNRVLVVYSAGTLTRYICGSLTYPPPLSASTCTFVYETYLSFFLSLFTLSTVPYTTPPPPPPHVPSLSFFFFLMRTWARINDWHGVTNKMRGCNTDINVTPSESFN